MRRMVLRVAQGAAGAAGVLRGRLAAHGVAGLPAAAEAQAIRAVDLALPGLGEADLGAELAEDLMES